MDGQRQALEGRLLGVRQVHVALERLQAVVRNRVEHAGADVVLLLQRLRETVAVLGDAEGGFSAPGTKPNDGYEFKGWDVDGDGAADVQDDALAALPMNRFGNVIGDFS